LIPGIIEEIVRRLVQLKQEAKDFCVSGNVLFTDSADQEANVDQTECELCYQNFSEEAAHQAVLLCTKEKACRSCILEQMGKELKEGNKPQCTHCSKPYLPSRAKLLMGECCILCLHEQNVEVCSQFVEGPVDSFKNSACGHRFCRKCIKDYLVKCWKRNDGTIKCPGLECPAVIDFNTQKEFLSQEIEKKNAKEKGITNTLLHVFKKYCRVNFSNELNPWIWISSCCKENINLPLQWVIRSWCPSIHSEISEEVLKCTKCETIWYGILFICTTSFSYFFLVLLV